VGAEKKRLLAFHESLVPKSHSHKKRGKRKNRGYRRCKSISNAIESVFEIGEGKFGCIYGHGWESLAWGSAIRRAEQGMARSSGGSKKRKWGVGPLKGKPRDLKASQGIRSERGQLLVALAESSLSRTISWEVENSKPAERIRSLGLPEEKIPRKRRDPRSMDETLAGAMARSTKLKKAKRQRRHVWLGERVRNGKARPSVSTGNRIPHKM